MKANSSLWIWVLLGRALLYAICGAILTALCGGFCGAVVGAIVSLAGGPNFGSTPVAPPILRRSFADALPGLQIGGLVGLYYAFLPGFITFWIGGFLSHPHDKGPLWARQMFRSLAFWMNVGQAFGAFAGGLAAASLGAALAFFQGSDMLDIAVSSTIAGAPVLMILGGIIGAVIGGRKAKSGFVE